VISGEYVEAFILKYWEIASWAAGGLCTVHGSVLLWVLRLIGKKVDRPEFESRILVIETQINMMHQQLIKIAEQNGSIKADVLATKEASEKGERNIKELIRQLEKRPVDGRKGD